MASVRRSYRPYPVPDVEYCTWAFAYSTGCGPVGHWKASRRRLQRGTYLLLESIHPLPSRYSLPSWQVEVHLAMAMYLGQLSRQRNGRRRKSTRNNSAATKRVSMRAPTAMSRQLSACAPARRRSRPSCSLSLLGGLLLVSRPPTRPPARTGPDSARNPASAPWMAMALTSKQSLRPIWPCHSSRSVASRLILLVCRQHDTLAAEQIVSACALASAMRP